MRGAGETDRMRDGQIRPRSALRARGGPLSRRTAVIFDIDRHAMRAGSPRARARTEGEDATYQLPGGDVRGPFINASSPLRRRTSFVVDVAATDAARRCAGVSSGGRRARAHGRQHDLEALAGSRRGAPDEYENPAGALHHPGADVRGDGVDSLQRPPPPPRRRRRPAAPPCRVRQLLLPRHIPGKKINLRTGHTNELRMINFQSFSDKRLRPVPTNRKASCFDSSFDD